MAINYAYNYAEIDLTTGMCIGVSTTSSPNPVSEEFIPIPVFDEEYILKYYNFDDGKFYYDVEYTREYISPLL